MKADTDAKALDRIAKLMRLATNNPHGEEARTAALRAVTLIVEHQFAIGRLERDTPITPPSLAEQLQRHAQAQYEAHRSRTPDGTPWWWQR